MKILHLAITSILMSLLLIIFLHPIQAQSIQLDQKNATLILNFTSEFDGYEGGSVAFSHNDDMFVYPIILKNPKLGWTSQLWLHYLKNDTSKFIGFNGSSSHGFYESFIGEPRFSSDDKKILFVGGNCDGNQSHTTFYAINLQNPRLQCNDLTNVVSADWMPDGSIILAQNNEKNDTISIYQDGKEKILYTKPITTPDDTLNSSHIVSIKASHDGTKIALWYFIRLYHETQILDVDKGKIIDTFAGGHPRWSQDDKMLLYSIPTNAGYYHDGPLKSRTYVNLLDVDDNKTTNIDTVNMGINDLALSNDSKIVFYVMKIPYPYDFLNFTSGIYKIELNHYVNNPSALTHMETPLRQFKSGTASKDITCRQDLLLIFKSSNEEPICVKLDDAKKLESRGWAISQYHDPGAKPKIKLYDYSYEGIDKDNGMISINNQTFYQTTLDYSVYDIPKKTSISFHDVIFAFPQGSLNTPGGSFVMLDMKFQDGFEEIYGGKAITRNGTTTMIGGIPIPTQYGPHVAVNSITILGNHTMPQAGITIYHDKIKLLVSADQLLTGNNNAVNSTAQVVPRCITNILNQTVFSGNAGVVLCPVMDYHVSSQITNYTGFYGKYDVLNSSSLVGPDTYVGTLQEEMDKSGNKMMDGNFVLEPGHNATITYQITLSTMKCIGSCPDHIKFPNVVNLTNNAEFIHREQNEMLHSHDGLEVKYDPQSVSLTDGQITTLKATITASKDVPRGTYWVILAPGNCAGGLLILLTVSDCEK
jgi:hypothetical protein